MANRTETGDVLMDELVNTARAVRQINREDNGVDAVPVSSLRDLAEAYSLIGTHFHHKKDRN